MFLGESFASSSRLQEDLWPFVHALTDSTVLRDRDAPVARRAPRVRADRQAVVEARAEALRADPVGYTKGLLDAAGVVAVLSDEGFPQPPIPAEEFERTIGVRVHRVARLEPWILEHRDGTFDDLVAGVDGEATAGRRRSELRRLQVDRRVPDRAGRRRPERGRGPRGLRGVARGRSGARRGSTRSRSGTS